ncbi:MAG: DUF1109 domain-containing protein [Pseudomonadota bacterium]
MVQIDMSTLVDDLTPVRVVKRGDSVFLAVGATFIASVMVAVIYGMRSDLMSGDPHPIVIIRASLLSLLGLATTLAVSSVAHPSIGKPQNGWVWALAAAAVLPLAAIAKFAYLYASGQPFDIFMQDFEFGPRCLLISGFSAVWIASFMTWWLRRGAPIALNRAGWLVGIAAGSFGTFSFNVYCNSISIFYIGFWYSLAVTLCAIAGRLIVPRLIRW